MAFQLSHDTKPGEDLEALVDQFSKITQKEGFGGYEKHIPGFEEAFKKGDVNECIKAIEKFLSTVGNRPLAEVLLKRLEGVKNAR